VSEAHAAQRRSPPVLVFDIETIPDCAGLRKLHALPDDLADAEVAEYAFQKQRAKNGSDFLPLHLQRVIVISCALRTASDFRVFSLAEPEVSEGQIIQRFFDGIAKYTPQLVSWNGGGFDLPVLHYRGLLHRVGAPRYWQMADEMKWDNYISRYHFRHTDLMDVLALYQPRANAPLDELAKLMDLPGKQGMAGDAVWPAWCAGRLADIRDYCETDVANTYLVWLRFQLMRGQLTAAEHDDELDFLRAHLEAQQAAHWREFVAAWRGR